MLLFEPVAAVVTDTPTGQNLMMELKNFRPVLQAGLALDSLIWEVLSWAQNGVGLTWLKHQQVFFGEWGCDGDRMFGII